MAYPRLMRNSPRSRLVQAAVLPILMLAGLAGCEPSYAPKRTIDLRPRIVEVVNHHGGNRRVMAHLDEHWYQSFGASIEVIDAESTYLKGDYGAFPSLKTTKAGHKALFGQILYPLAADEVSPEFVDLSTEDLLGAKIITENSTDVFLKSYSGKKSQKSGISFEGDFAWVSLSSGELSKTSGQSVKRISYNEQPILSSDKSVTFALKLGELIELGVAVDEPTRITLHLGRKLTSVTSSDGEAVPFVSDGDRVEILIQESGNYFLK